MGFDFWEHQAQKNAPAPQPQKVWPPSRSPYANPFWPPQQEQAQQQTVPQAGAYGIPQSTSSGQMTQEELEILQASTKSATMVNSSKECCPSCGGFNYTSTGFVASRHGSFENKRCWDCGFPVRHDGVPPSLTPTTGRAGMARQTASGGAVVNNYHPQMVGIPAIDGQVNTSGA